MRNYKQHVWLLMPWNAKNPTFIYRQFWAFRGLTGLSPQTIYWGSSSDPRGVLLSLDPLCSAHLAAKPRLCYYRQLMLTLTLIILTIIIIIIMCMPRPGAWLSSRIASTYRGFELVARQWTDPTDSNPKPNFHYFCMHSMPFTTRNELPANDIILLRICE